jgi:hypothetical protein
MDQFLFYFLQYKIKARICDRIEMLHGIAIRSQIIKQATKLYTIKI